eukprot:CAMPEP_0184548188 /NCGR_PEP_ID=MMETSP0199_2-20130426/6041_1 /TAXON_ID=1112570 /ORGANISM="Thraustochytrium sp., Strain LLF1b" /LENGTH=571 /DNA_ID=CAMNT_0026942771 /DNA_START=260 /DNA_END=1975 /DNA_ORIENTATION=+
MTTLEQEAKTEAISQYDDNTAHAQKREQGMEPEKEHDQGKEEQKTAKPGENLEQFSKMRIVEEETKSTEEEEVVRKGAWSSEEDELLQKVLKDLSFHCDPHSKWSTVANFVPGRTAKQCRERWCYNLDPAICKGPWLPEEDQILITSHNLLGNRWAQIATWLPGRTENSVKTRFNSLARAKRRAWTPEEDEIILAYHRRIGCKWDKIASKLQNRRTKNAVKTRFRVLSRGNAQNNQRSLPTPNFPQHINPQQLAFTFPSGCPREFMSSSHQVPMSFLPTGNSSLHQLIEKTVDTTTTQLHRTPSADGSASKMPTNTENTNALSNKRSLSMFANSIGINVPEVSTATKEPPLKRKASESSSEGGVSMDVRNSSTLLWNAINAINTSQGSSKAMFDTIHPLKSNDVSSLTTKEGSRVGPDSVQMSLLLAQAQHFQNNAKLAAAQQQSSKPNATEDPLQFRVHAALWNNHKNISSSKTQSPDATPNATPLLTSGGIWPREMCLSNTNATAEANVNKDKGIAQAPQSATQAAMQLASAFQLPPQNISASSAYNQAFDRFSLDKILSLALSSNLSA